MTSISNIQAGTAIIVRNETGATIGARSIVKLSSANSNPTAKGSPHLLITVPSASSSSEIHAAVSALDIPNNKNGLVHLLTRPAWVKYIGATAPVAGDDWGITASTFTISSSGSGLYVFEAQTVGTDKYALVASLSGNGGTSAKIRFVITAASSGLGMGATACNFATATVTYLACGYTGVAVGDEIQVYDPEFCHFNLPIALLVGLNGKATLMDNPFTQYDIDNAVDCVYDIVSQGTCLWMVDTLCCSEEEVIL